MLDQTRGMSRARPAWARTAVPDMVVSCVIHFYCLTLRGAFSSYKPIPGNLGDFEDAPEKRL